MRRALALGDDAVVPQAAKTTANDAANTAPLIDHLFGVWDMLPVSSSGAPGADRLPPCPAAGACLFPAEANAPGASRRKPSISATERHVAEIASSGRGRRRVQESAEPAGHVVEAPRSCPAWSGCSASHWTAKLSSDVVGVEERAVVEPHVRSAACRSRPSARRSDRSPWRATGPSPRWSARSRTGSRSAGRRRGPRPGRPRRRSTGRAGSAVVSQTSWRRSPGVIAANRSSRSGDVAAPVTSARKAALVAVRAIGTIGTWLRIASFALA